MVVSAVKDGHLLEWNPLVEKLHHALRDERRLLGIRGQSNKSRLDGMLPANRLEVFRKLFFVRKNRGVCEIEDLRNASVIFLDFENPGVGTDFRKVQNVFKIRAAPRVDALRVVAHDHHIPVMEREAVDQLGLQPVRVLILIDKDVLELALVALRNLRAGGEKLECFREEIVEIQGVRLALSGLVGDLDFLDLGRERDEVAVFLGQNLRNRGGGVDRIAENIRQHRGFRKLPRCVHESLLRNDRGNHVLRVLAIHD